MIYIIIYSLLSTQLIQFFTKELTQSEIKQNNWILIVYIIIPVLNIMLYMKHEYSIEFIKYSVLTSFLILISIIDYYTMYIYDITIIIGILSQSILLIISNNLMLNHILGLSCGFLISYIIVKVTKSLGSGDIGVYSLCCFCLGINYSFYIIMLSFVIGSIYGIYQLIIKRQPKKTYIPFAPCISLATILVILTEYGILNWYINKII